MFADTYAKELFDDIVDLMNQVKDLLIEEFKKQGHNNTGNYIKQAESVVDFQGLTVRGRLFLAAYFEYLERRLPASQVPYQRGSGRGRSKVVQALIRYFDQRGARDPKAATFATLNKWKKEGRPTRASYRFSSNGRRLRPLGYVLDNLDKKIEELLQRQAAKGLEAVINNIAENTQRRLRA